MKNKPYLIEWIDSYSDESMGWKFRSDNKKPKLLYCVSVGYILKETEDSIQVTPHISDTKNKNKDHQCVCGEMTIPKVAIIKRVKLKLEK